MGCGEPAIFIATAEPDVLLGVIAVLFKYTVVVVPVWITDKWYQVPVVTVFIKFCIYVADEP